MDTLPHRVCPTHDSDYLDVFFSLSLHKIVMSGSSDDCHTHLDTSVQILGLISIPCSTGESESCLCPDLCDPMGYTVHGIPQARILEWVAVPFSRGSSQPRDQTHVSHIEGGFFTS